MTQHSYSTPAEVRDIIQAGADLPDSALQDTIDVATRMIDEYCGRVFTQAMGEARVFGVELDLIGSVHPSMQIDDVLGMPDESTGTAAKVELANTPVDDWSEQADGWWFGPLTPKPNWPLTEFHVKEARLWRNRYIRITTDWGWSSIPAPVSRACAQLAARAWQRRLSVMGQLGTGEFGAVFIRRVDPDVQNWLRPFKRDHLIGW